MRKLGREMTTGREIARGDKAAKVVYQKRCSSRESMRVLKSGGKGETIPTGALKFAEVLRGCRTQIPCSCTMLHTRIVLCNCHLI